MYTGMHAVMSQPGSIVGGVFLQVNCECVLTCAVYS